MSTTQLTYQADYPGLAESRLLGQHQDLPRLSAFARALGAGTQLLEDAAFSVLTSTLAICSAHRLDQWGDLVGEPRGGLTDAQYRGFIEARILANRSTGREDEIIRVAQLVTTPSIIRTTTLAPKHLTMYVYRDSFMDRRLRARVGRLLRSIHAAGTYLELIEVQVGHFGFSSDPGGSGFGVGLFSRII